MHSNSRISGRVAVVRKIPWNTLWNPSNHWLTLVMSSAFILFGFWVIIWTLQRPTGSGLRPLVGYLLLLFPWCIFKVNFSMVGILKGLFWGQLSFVHFQLRPGQDWKMDIWSMVYTLQTTLVTVTSILPTCCFTSSSFGTLILAQGP